MKEYTFCTILESANRLDDERIIAFLNNKAALGWKLISHSTTCNPDKPSHIHTFTFSREKVITVSPPKSMLINN